MVPAMSNDQTVYRHVDTANDRYTVIDNQNVAERKELSWEARGLLVYLLSRPRNWVVRRADLVKQSPAGESVVRRILQELRDHGYLRYVARPQEDGRFSYITTVHDRPLPGEPDERRRTWTGYLESCGGDSTSRDSSGGISSGGKSSSRDSAKVVSTDVESTEVQSTDVQTTDLETTDDPSGEGSLDTGDTIDYDGKFNEAYELYPRKTSRKAAKKAWDTHVKKAGVDPEKVVTGVRNYALQCKKDGTEKKFIKHPSTFFGPSDWWDDFQETVSLAGSRRQNVMDREEDEALSGEVSIEEELGL
jgi:hypothetical protein